MDLPEIGGRTPWHLFDRESVLAVNTALDCGRPLLIRGDPGTGKSQLARAAAKKLGRVFLSRVVDAHTEAHELLWEYDALARLSDAQTLGVARRRQTRDRLARANYTQPGPLWWALDWDSAMRQAQRASIEAPKSGFGRRENGVVVLIDEIDKADVAVPNALLECLGHGSFTVPGIGQQVCAKEPAPLIILTTNTNRILPDAFVRRCVVLHVRVPEDGLIEWLVKRGRPHFPELPEDVLRRAAEQLKTDRARLGSRAFCAPGLAEYIDLLTAAVRGGAEQAEARLASIARFVLDKHIDPGPMNEQ
ncbi:MAG: MoxR family ATPase [Enhygromyxa sp.]